MIKKYDIKNELKRIRNFKLRSKAREELLIVTGLTKTTLHTYMYTRGGVNKELPYVELIEKVIQKYEQKEEELLNSI